MGIMYKLMKHRKLNLDLRQSAENTNLKSDRSRLITIEGNIIEAPVSSSKYPTKDDTAPNLDASTDKQFTAEHIIQLCKFLAEKSRKNKSLYKQQQSPKKLTTSKQAEFVFKHLEDQDNCDESDLYHNEALPLLSKRRMDEEHELVADNENKESDEFELQRNASVLSARLSPDINSLNISLNTTTAHSCASQHHQQLQPQIINNNHLQHQQQQPLQHQPHEPQQSQSQGKRDILLKIRRQIIERKRLRENGAFEPQALNSSQVWRPW